MLKRKTPLRAKKRWVMKARPSKKSTKRLLGGNKRRKKTPRQKAEEKLWELCKQITRKRYQNPNGGWTCYTSGQHIDEPAKCQTGHGKPKGALPLRFQYDLRNLRPQCYHANINLGGMQDIFIARLEREPEGLAFLQEACVKEDGEWKIRRDIPTMSGTDALIFLNEKIDEYTKILLG